MKQHRQQEKELKTLRFQPIMLNLDLLQGAFTQESSSATGSLAITAGASEERPAKKRKTGHDVVGSSIADLADAYRQKFATDQMQKALEILNTEFSSVNLPLSTLQGALNQWQASERAAASFVMANNVMRDAILLGFTKSEDQEALQRSLAELRQASHLTD